MFQSVNDNAYTHEIALESMSLIEIIAFHAINEFGLCLKAIILNGIDL